MDNRELALLADHMGHSVNIHTDVYKLQSSLLERTKVAKLLCAVESGTVSKYKESTEIDDAVNQIQDSLMLDDEGENSKL